MQGTILGASEGLDLTTALVHRPRLLFLDEQAAGLDLQSRAAIWAYLEKLNKKEGTTIFLTTNIWKRPINSVGNYR